MTPPAAGTLTSTEADAVEEAALTGHAYGALDAPPVAATFGSDHQGLADRIMVGVFVAVPLLAVLVAVPVAWGWGIGWTELVLAVGFYAIASHGITVGFHRYFTHGSFKANRALKVAMAVAGSLAIEGPVVRWVADHRKHHAYSDADGDPHSPGRTATARGPSPAVCCTPTPAGSSTSSRPRCSATRRTCSRTRTSSGSRGCSRCGSPSPCCCRRCSAG